MSDVADALFVQVASLRRWAAGVPAAEKVAEWECLYPDWHHLRAAASAFIRAVSCRAWSDEQCGLVLYAIARDNEDEIIADAIAETPEALLRLAEFSVGSTERDAKWQLATRLGGVRERASQAESILLRLVEDADEYVRRRALLALGRLRSPHTEECAERAWQTGHQYQRMAALTVLKQIGSGKLQDYFRMAEEDGREHLVAKAKELRREA